MCLLSSSLHLTFFVTMDTAINLTYLSIQYHNHTIHIITHSSQYNAYTNRQRRISSYSNEDINRRILTNIKERRHFHHIWTTTLNFMHTKTSFDEYWTRRHFYCANIIEFCTYKMKEEGIKLWIQFKQTSFHWHFRTYFTFGDWFFIPLTTCFIYISAAGWVWYLGILLFSPPVLFLFLLLFHGTKRI